MAKKFEYQKIVTLRDEKDDTVDKLNELGKKGWEVISVDEHATGGYHVWLKKEV